MSRQKQIIQDVPKGLFLLVLILGLATAQEDGGDIPQTEDIQEVLKNLQLMLEMKFKELMGLQDFDHHEAERVNLACGCSGLKCECCHYIKIWSLGISDDCCLSVEYHSHNFSIHIVFRFGSRVLFFKELSARNPPPLCLPIPYLIRASACLEFYDLSFVSWTFSGCVRGQVYWFGWNLLNIDLGCFKIRLKNANTTDAILTIELSYREKDGMKQGYKNLFFMITKASLENIILSGVKIDDD